MFEITSGRPPAAPLHSVPAPNPESEHSNLHPLFLDLNKGILLGPEGRSLSALNAAQPIQGCTWPEDVPFPLQDLLEAAEETRFLTDPPFALPLGDVAILYGDGGIGKSWFALQLAVSVASGRSFLGKPVKARNVLYLDFENSLGELGRRVSALTKILDLPVAQLLGKLFIQPYANTGRLLEGLEESVHRLLEAVRPGLIVVDGWQAAFGGDPVNPEHVTSAFKLLKRLAGTDRAVLVLTHVSTSQLERKPSSGGHVKRAGTSSRIPTPAGNRFVQHFARAAYYLQNAGEAGAVLRVGKENLGVPTNSVELRRTRSPDGMAYEIDKGFVVDISSEALERQSSQTKSEEDRVLDIIITFGREVGAPELYELEAKRIGKTTKTAKRRIQPILQTLVEQGKVNSRTYRNTIFVSPTNT